MKLAVVRHEGSPDRWLVGLIDEVQEAILRGEPIPTEPHAYAPDEDGPVLDTGAVCRWCKQPRGHQLHTEPAPYNRDADERDDDDEPEERGPVTITLEAPGVMVLLVTMGEHPMGGGPAAAVVPIVQVLPYTHEQVYLDGVVGLALEELEGVDGQPPAYVVELYTKAREAAIRANAVPAGSTRRRRVVP